MELVRSLVLSEAFKGELEAEIPGTLGQILIFRNPPNTTPERLAVKTVMPDRFKDRTPYEALRRFQHEIRQWIRYRHHPFIIAPFFTRVVRDWPYVAMPYCEANLRRYIDRSIPRGGTSEPIALMIELITGLTYANTKGLVAHQDLKPENILLRDLHNMFAMPEEYPFRWVARVADFGLANAYAELGLNWGSRPYLAPEQYDGSGDFAKVDAFACGVMLCELLTGNHPIGVVTSQVWPTAAPGAAGRWRHEDVWKKWSRSPEKLSTKLRGDARPYTDLVISALSVDPAARPSLVELRDALVGQIERSDRSAFENLRLLLNHYDKLSREAESYEETVDRYEQKKINELLKRHFH
jgi:serine/threonine protein kinase